MHYLSSSNIHISIKIVSSNYMIIIYNNSKNFFRIILQVVDDLYPWTVQQQGLILSSFYWGYVLTHIPGGVIAEKFGGKYVLGLGILSTSIFTLLTPLIVYATEGNWVWVVALRVCEGLGEVSEKFLEKLNFHAYTSGECSYTNHVSRRWFIEIVLPWKLYYVYFNKTIYMDAILF